MVQNRRANNGVKGFIRFPILQTSFYELHPGKAPASSEPEEVRGKVYGGKVRARRGEDLCE